MTWFLDNYELIGEAVLALIVLASVIVKLTPSEADDKWFTKAMVRLSAFWPWGGLKLPLLQGLDKDKK